MSASLGVAAVLLAGVFSAAAQDGQAAAAAASARRQSTTAPFVAARPSSAVPFDHGNANVVLNGGGDALGARIVGYSAAVGGPVAALVSPRVVAVRFRAQVLARGEYVTHVLQAGENVSHSEPGNVGDEYQDSALWRAADGSVATAATGVPPSSPGGTVWLGYVGGPRPGLPWLPQAGESLRLREFDAVHGAALDEVWADAPASYALRAASGAAGTGFAAAGGAVPVNVGRKTKMTEFGYCGATWGDKNSAGHPLGSDVIKATCWVSEHIVTLEFAEDIPLLGDQASYDLIFPGSPANGTLAGVTAAGALNGAGGAGFLPSPAVHINQLGFVPDDLGYAYLSFWRGAAGGVDYSSASLDWHVADAADPSQVLAVAPAPAALRGAASQGENLAGTNLALADVYEMDLSSLPAGSPLPQDRDLIVVVDSIGASRPFRVSRSVYASALSASLRVFYYQRNAVALDTTWEGVPYTRDATFRVDLDGTSFIGFTNTSLAETGNSDIGGGFSETQGWGAILAGFDPARGQCNATGGWMDAGDWDTRSPHLKAARYLMFLLERFPALYSSLDLGLPGAEGTNGIPDILDQALFLVDSLAVGQQPDGGVISGYETLSHPRFGDISTSQSQPYFCYSPDPWSTFQFAATAAYAARLISPYDPVRGNALSTRAYNAYLWANARKDVVPPRLVTVESAAVRARYLEHLRDERGRAAMHLLLLFNGNTELEGHVNEEQRCTSGGILGGGGESGAELAWLVTHHSPSAAYTNATLKAACAAALAGAASLSTTGSTDTFMRIPLASFMPELSFPANGLTPFMVMGLDANGVSTAGGRAMLRQLGQALAFTFGSNPTNQAYMTEGGANCLFSHPGDALLDVLRIDSLYVKDVDAPPGLTVIGPAKAGAAAGVPLSILSSIYPYPAQARSLWPSADADWPSMENFAVWPLLGEYTPHSTLGDQVMQLGFYVGAMHELGLAEARNASASRSDPKTCPDPIPPSPNATANGTAAATTGGMATTTTGAATTTGAVLSPAPPSVNQVSAAAAAVSADRMTQMAAVAFLLVAAVLASHV